MVIEQQQWEWLKIDKQQVLCHLEVSLVCLIKFGFLEVGSSENVSYLFPQICILNIYLLWECVCGLTNKTIFSYRHHCSHPYSLYLCHLLNSKL